MTKKNTYAKIAASKFNSKRNYSDFWMDSKWDRSSMFSGMPSSLPGSSDLVKAIKLANYRRAITNFVKILTTREIPVVFAGDTSYTNGKGIVLSTDIKDNNFDVTVGLALHEASHIVLTDFTVLEALLNDSYTQRLEALGHKIGSGCSSYAVLRLVKDLLNWVEDRRIDNFVFTTSPGYKAYYHKLYDYYFHDKSITKALQSRQFSGSNPTNGLSIDVYMMHIINMINPAFKANALPGLQEIVNLVDLRNINRLKNTTDSLEVAFSIAEIILANVSAAKQKTADQEEAGAGEQANKLPGDASSSNSNSDEKNEEATEETTEETTEEAELEELSVAEIMQAEKALQNQRDFINGAIKKKEGTKNLGKLLQSVSKQAIDLQPVTVGSKNYNTIVADYSRPEVLGEMLKMQDLLNDYYSKQYSARTEEDNVAIKAVQQRQREMGYAEILYVTNAAKDYVSTAVSEGINMGALLGKKLQLHNEARERVDMRLRSGQIDNKRLAHAGYGIESIFKQISIDKYRKANLHISLDASGSMGGNKWASTLKLTAGIVKALTYTQGINVQVSLRGTTRTGRHSHTATVITIYNSITSRNNPTNFFKLLPYLDCNSVTPEGLCFESMIKKNLLTPGTSDLDSYFLNISDGEPCMDSYTGPTAEHHTATQVKKMEGSLNMQILSFFIAEGNIAEVQSQFNNSYHGRAFKTMYGKAAAVVNPDSAMDIAKELNKKFMAAKA